MVNRQTPHLGGIEDPRTPLLQPEIGVNQRPVLEDILSLAFGVGQESGGGPVPHELQSGSCRTTACHEPEIRHRFAEYGPEAPPERLGIGRIRARCFLVSGRARRCVPIFVCSRMAARRQTRSDVCDGLQFSEDSRVSYAIRLENTKWSE